MEELKFQLSSQGKVFEAPKWWMFIQCDSGIVNFYQWLCRRNGLDILKGAKSGPHISLVRGETPKFPDNWKNFLNQKIKFKYSNQVRYNDSHAWLEIEPEPCMEIRAELGLPRFNRFHMTIGRFKHKVIG